jgi:ketosteroid isomerase-like protein
MSTPDFAQAVEKDHRATDALIRGDAEPKKEMFSRREDVTLANPVSPPVRGWNHIAETLDGVASQLRDGEPIGFDRVSDFASKYLGYIVEIERTRTRIGDADELASFSLRVTTTYRREEDGWKIAHRHADSITGPRPLASVLEQ